MSVGGHEPTMLLEFAMSPVPSIVLQKSKVAGLRIFRENKKREANADSYNLNRVTAVACEFSVAGLFVLVEALAKTSVIGMITRSCVKERSSQQLGPLGARASLSLLPATSSTICRQD